MSTDYDTIDHGKLAPDQEEISSHNIRDDSSSLPPSTTTISQSIVGGDETLTDKEKSDLQALIGPGHQVVQVEKKVVVHTSEVIMVNGTPIQLDGLEGDMIKKCLLQGTMPNQDLINHLLHKAGLFLKPIKQVLEADINVSSLDRKSECAIVKNDALNSPHKIISNVTEHVQNITNSASMELNSIHSKSFTDHLEYFLTEPLNCDEDYQYSLLLWSRLYMTPSIILPQINAKVNQLLPLKCFNKLQSIYEFLSKWLTWFPEDFAEESSMQKFKKLFTQLNDCQQLSHENKLHLISSLIGHLKVLKKFDPFLGSNQELSFEKNFATCLELPTTQMAQELTRIELDYLSNLSGAEFINVFARDSKEDEKLNVYDARIRCAQKTRIFDFYVKWFNHLSFLVAASVCHTRKKKLRVKIVEYWIEVARICVNIGNFNSLMGIITGLNMFPVARLHKTWAKVQSGKFRVLEHQMDPRCNFHSYRSTYTAAIVRSKGATDDAQKIIIPFFSLFVKDLYTAKEEITANEKTFEIKSVQNISKTIKEFYNRKNVSCPFEKSPQISEYILQSVLDEEELDFQSFCREVPKNHMEREQFKKLKYKKTKLKSEKTSHTILK